MTASRLYRAALLCGAAPLAAGIGILLLWIVTRADALEEAGAGCILLGTVSVVLGVLLLVLWSRKLDPKASTWKANLGAVVLLLINFPAAAGAIAVAYALKHPVHEIVIEDVTKEQTITLTTDLKLPSSIEIRAIGDLDGPATISTESSWTLLALNPGPVDVRGGSDCYVSTFQVRYVPRKVTRGRLRVEYRFH